MKKPVLYLLLAAVLFTSCATASLSKYRGVGRIKQYDFYSYDVPSAFDGFRIGFASDFHYESRFTRKRLDNAIRALQSLNADVLLLGGDYGSPKGGDMDTLFTALGKVLTPYGIYGVMGNHDYSYCYTKVAEAMKKNSRPRRARPRTRRAGRLRLDQPAVHAAGIPRPRLGHPAAGLRVLVL